MRQDAHHGDVSSLHLHVRLMRRRTHANCDVWQLHFVTGRGLRSVVSGNMFYNLGCSVSEPERHPITGAGHVYQHVKNDVSCAACVRQTCICMIHVVPSEKQSVCIHANVHVVMIYIYMYVYIYIYIHTYIYIYRRT